MNDKTNNLSNWCIGIGILLLNVGLWGLWGWSASVMLDGAFLVLAGSEIAKENKRKLARDYLAAKIEEDKQRDD